jgi:hypothetical protein
MMGSTISAMFLRKTGPFNFCSTAQTFAIRSNDPVQLIWLQMYPPEGEERF